MKKTDNPMHQNALSHHCCGRSAVHAPRGMAAASQPLAVAAGLELLRAGGAAADAAVAMAAVLAVTEPCSTGLGGDAFALHYDPAAAHGQRVRALNGSGRAPMALTREALLRLDMQTSGHGLPLRHAVTITTPGACAAWADLHCAFGALPWKEVLAPAIRYAREGFAIGPVTARLWRDQAPLLRAAKSPRGPGALLPAPGGRPPAVGVLTRNEDLARVLEHLATEGSQAFYQGELAAAIVEATQTAGGLLTAEDMAAHASRWDDPATVSFQGHTVCECPPNGQGVVALMALAMLESRGVVLDAPTPRAVGIHWMVEALRLAFAEAKAHVADPDHMRLSVQELLDSARLARLAAAIDPQRRRPLPQGAAPGGSETVYFCVVDDAGRAVSMVNSNYLGFGTGIVPAGMGFSLQNRGANFTLEENHANTLAPGKRPYHTIIPGMLLDGAGELVGPFGVMGGFMQPQGHVQVLTNLLCRGLDPQSALDAPRFCLPDGDPGDDLCLECEFPVAMAHDLARRGHTVRVVAGHDRALFGRGQIILRDKATGVLTAGSDPRADGCAMGY